MSTIANIRGRNGLTEQTNSTTNTVWLELNAETLNLLNELRNILQMIDDGTLGGGTGGTNIHNDLGGLQGGTATERFHLTASDHNFVTNLLQNVLNTLTTNVNNIISDNTDIMNILNNLKQLITSGNLKGEVQMFPNLPAVGNDVGDIWFVINDNLFYRWNGTSWVAVTGMDMILPHASTTQRGIIRIATLDEVEACASNDTAVSPAALCTYINERLASLPSGPGPLLPPNLAMNMFSTAPGVPLTGSSMNPIGRITRSIERQLTIVSGVSIHSTSDNTNFAQRMNAGLVNGVDGDNVKWHPELNVFLGLGGRNHHAVRTVAHRGDGINFAIRGTPLNSEMVSHLALSSVGTLTPDFVWNPTRSCLMSLNALSYDGVNFTPVNTLPTSYSACWSNDHGFGIGINMMSPGSLADTRIHAHRIHSNSDVEEVFAVPSPVRPARGKVIYNTFTQQFVLASDTNIWTSTDGNVWTLRPAAFTGVIGDLDFDPETGWMFATSYQNVLTTMDVHFTSDNFNSTTSTTLAAGGTNMIPKCLFMTDLRQLIVMSNAFRYLSAAFATSL